MTYHVKNFLASTLPEVLAEYLNSEEEQGYLLVASFEDRSYIAFITYKKEN